MPQIVKNSTRTVSRDFRIPFHYRGNIETPVYKINSNLGDGDVGTGKDSKKYTYVTARIFCENNSQIRLHVRYEIRESKFGTQKNHDGLYMEFDVTQSIASFFREGNYTETENGGKIKRVYTPQSLVFKKSYPVASGSWNHTGSMHNYRDLSKISPNLPDWFPASELQIKIDDEGKELTGKGNIGIKGCALVTVVRTDKIVETITQDDPVTVGPAQGPKKGNETKVTSFHDCVDGVLGRGYDICGFYADPDSCKDKVVDYKKLNEYNRIRKVVKNTSDSKHYTGEGIQEYSYKREEKLSVKVSASAFGASFSNETTNSFSEETYNKCGYRYATQNDTYIKDQYVVQGNNDAAIMMGFLTQDFLDDLDRMSADEIIERYGTHVVLGMQVGTIFSYHMSYRQSTQKISKASMFSNTTSISYNSSGNASPKDSGGSKKSETESIYQDLINDKLSPAALNAYANYLKVAKNASAPTGGSGSGSNSGGGGGGWSVSGEVSYSRSMAQTLLNEDQSSNYSCKARGGNAQLANLLTKRNDFNIDDYKAWMNTCTDNNLVFVDFVPGTLLPLYTLIPSGKKLTAQQVKDASDRWQKKHSISTPSAMRRGTILVPFNTIGKPNTENLNSDNEIYSDNGKPIYWKLIVELVNYDNGRCGYIISLKVNEYGRGANYTVLLNHVASDIALQSGCNAMAIDSNSPSLGGKTLYEVEADWKGTFTEWKSVEDIIQGSDMTNVIDLNAGPCEVHLDGKGDDLDHVGVRGYIKIPWIGYWD